MEQISINKRLVPRIKEEYQHYYYKSNIYDIDIYHDSVKKQCFNTFEAFKTIKHVFSIKINE